MADQPVTIEKLIKADIDADNLGKAANEKVIINPRYGDPYKSAPLVIEEMQTKADQLVAQGFYKGYTTEALLLADKPAVAEMRARADDTRKIYRWTRTSAEGVTPVTGTWADTGLSDKDIAAADATAKANAAEANAKTYVNEKTKSISDIDIGEALFAKTDANGNLIEVTGKDGKQYLTGMDGSVQDNINKNSVAVDAVKKTVDSYNDSQIFLAFVDKDDRVIAYFKNNTDFHLLGLEYSVQHEINTAKNMLSDFISSIGKTEVKTVKGLVKSNYTVDASAILSMKVDASNSMPYIKMDSPYRKDDFFVHPCVIELTEPMRGYKYLMCITPYYLRNPLEENPTIYGSNDQVTWEMLTGFEQPLDNPPEWDEPESGEHGYLSDNWWAYDPINKELYCCYRKGYYANYEAGYTNDDRMQLLYRKTTNGLQWSAPKMFTPETTLGTDGQVAPSLIYDKTNNRWALFYLKTSDSRIYVRFNTELKVEGWTDTQEIGFKAFADANNIRGWHIETKFIGDKLFMLIGDSVNGKYYFAKANDDTFLNWTFSANSVLADTWTSGAYKASFLEVPQENGNIKLRLYFTSGVGRLITSLSPEISII